MSVDIRDQCKGRWASVLINLGVDQKLLNGRHQPCIYCGGKDRARWDRQKEVYFCSGCGHKQPIDFAIEWLNSSFKDTANHIRQIIGDCKLETISPIDEAKKQKKNEERLKRIHAGLKRITPDCVAGLYLANRGITVLPESDCYFNPGVPYFDNGEKTGVFPAMVSVFRTREGDVATYHITYLTPDGKKLDCVTPKKILPTIHQLSGSAIQLFKPKELLCIAEGIETALAVYQDSGFPVWAAGNSSCMENLDIPEGVDHFHIYADSEDSFAGGVAAYSLAKKIRVMQSRRVKEGASMPGEQTCWVIKVINGVMCIDKGIKEDYLDYMLASTIKDKKAA